MACVRMRVEISSLTTGGTPRRYCTLYSTFSGASSDETISRTSVFHRHPGFAAGRADGAGHRAGLRDGVGGHARVDRAPHHDGAVARVDPPRQHPGHPGDQGAQRVDQVAGQMRSRRVPAGRVQRDLDLIGRRRDRARP